MPTMTINIKFPATIYREDDVFVSVCPLFDVASQGCTELEAKENLREAVQLFIETCIEMGTIRQIMKECGFYKAEKDAVDENCENNLSIDLPYIASKSFMECRA